ncbi:MAG TPA: ribosome small subunit-dependent GTPase A [Candidatus Lambdaproteobacteria bacterium]|nr:ribosome small subunit-dependent GTPase A [SAR324 cluster bacterium]HBL54727.1 ribosome small subunit-dependent GTPase A [Deltaproteobacteria bacterium]HHZ78989.1 ribosome small subunit-dependent GTPase A [Candidatus Lambdaproteobacteria bacterium]HIA57490.1 ribosome small subunit-dependent GTPase A [Candidatus Lambdaproteobacteria bacterium]HIB44840.1 ribosome small subunit-dependent GTPase A [Candidatus Lambdaproteobacteria bacterium]
MPQTGTVVRRTKSFYYVDVGEPEPRLCRIRGKLFKGQSHQNKIAVGDEVEIDLKAAEDAGWILRMLPRRTKLSRRPGMGEPEHVLVSNADTLLIVASLRNPPFRGGLVDRFLVAGSCGGLEPVLILSKADLVTSAEITPIKNLYSSLNCTVLVTSVPESRGLEPLRVFMQNRTSVLSGHSGVGKSSLIAALFPDWKIRIGQVSEKSGKGRHTTIMAEMFRLPQGGFIVDTPGIRALEPLVSPEELDSHFVEFTPFLGQCKFKGCTHRHEPQCLIKEAVTSEKITEQRYKSYCSLFDSL